MFLETRGARLFFTDEGSGDPMVFVHGFSCDSHDWSWQLPHFLPSHRVIALDLRGHGSSSAPEGGYDIQSLAADVAALVDHLQTGPVVAVGHSLGGAICATLAIERPELVRAVVAVDPGILLPDDLGPVLAEVAAAYETLDPADVARQAFDGASHVLATPPALATWHNRRVAGQPVHAMRQTITGLIGGEKPFALRSQCEPYLSRLQRPILSFYIDQVRAAAAEEVFPKPPSHTVCFEGSGHWVHQERSAEVNTVIDRWLVGLS